MLALNRFTLACALMSGTIAFAQKPISDVPELPLADAIQIALANNRPVEISKLDITKSNWQVGSNEIEAISGDQHIFLWFGESHACGLHLQEGHLPER